MAVKERPRILLIKPTLPYPPDMGTKLLSFNLIRALQERFDVTVLARVLSAGETPYADELSKHCRRVVTVFAPNKQSVFHKVFYKALYNLKNLLMKRSMKSSYDCPGVFLKAARKLAAEHFDYHVVEYWQLWRMAEVLPLDRTVLLSHDVEMLVNRQNALMERNLFLKIRAVRRWLYEQREEIRAYRTFRRILALTERDRTAIQAIAGEKTPVEVLPFGLDPGDYPDLGIKRNPREVLFVGVMTASFNRDALQFFIRRIYPNLHHLEGLKITIVGGRLPRELAYLQQAEGVEITGKVLDVRPYLARAACLVIPLQFGGGLRTRVLEAMFAGLPVVCTSVAMAGMPFEPEMDYLLADSPEEFGRQIGRLLGSPGLPGKISNSAKEKVLKLYSRSAQAARLESLFQGFINT